MTWKSGYVVTKLADYTEICKVKWMKSIVTNCRRSLKDSAAG